MSIFSYKPLPLHFNAVSVCPHVKWAYGLVLLSGLCLEVALALAWELLGPTSSRG